MHGVVCTRDRQLTRQPPHATVISCTQRAGYRPHLIATCALSIASVITRRGRHLANRSVGGTDDYLDYHGVRSLNKQPLKACLQAGLKRVFGQILSRGRAVVLVCHACKPRVYRSSISFNRGPIYQWGIVDCAARCWLFEIAFDSKERGGIYIYFFSSILGKF